MDSLTTPRAPPPSRETRALRVWVIVLAVACVVFAAAMGVMTYIACRNVWNQGYDPLRAREGAPTDLRVTSDPASGELVARWGPCKEERNVTVFRAEVLRAGEVVQTQTVSARAAPGADEYVARFPLTEDERRDPALQGVRVIALMPPLELGETPIVAAAPRRSQLKPTPQRALRPQPREAPATPR